LGEQGFASKIVGREGIGTGERGTFYLKLMGRKAEYKRGGNKKSEHS